MMRSGWNRLSAYLRSLSHQLVDGHDDLPELRPGYAPVAIQIIQLERPPQLLVDGPAEQSGKSHQHVL